MPYMTDTSVLMRYSNATDVQHLVAMQAILTLHKRKEIVHSTAQNYIEFRNSATRPVAMNGLGLSVAKVEAEVVLFESNFPLLPEIPDIYPAWKALVSAAGVIGKQVHDARLVAVCQVYDITHLLTFNIGHFTRLAAFVPGLTIVDPATV